MNAQVLGVDFTSLDHVNTVAGAGDLRIDQVEDLDSRYSGTWYRYPSGDDIWEIQLEKDGATFFSEYSCLRQTQQWLWDVELARFAGILYRVGPETVGFFQNVVVMPSFLYVDVPNFADRAQSIKFVTHGSSTPGPADYYITLHYADASSHTTTVSIGSAMEPAWVLPPPGYHGYQIFGTENFVSDECGQTGYVVVINNPDLSRDLIDFTIQYSGTDLPGPLAVSLEIDQPSYDDGYIYSGLARSGNDQSTALRAAPNPVHWTGLTWVATSPEAGGSIQVNVLGGDPQPGGAIDWMFIDTIEITPGNGAASFAMPGMYEYVKCEIEMVAELHESPILQELSFTYDVVSDVPEPGAVVPDLLGNAPNPFNPQTTIAFDLSKRTAVSLRVFDLSGRLVKVLVDRDAVAAGRNEVIWNGRDDLGRQVASGTYFYRLEAGEYSETKRMALIK